MSDLKRNPLKARVQECGGSFRCFVNPVNGIINKVQEYVILFVNFEHKLSCTRDGQSSENT